MKSTTRKIFVALMLGAFVLGSTGCNTMAGVGKDTQKVGDKIESEAEEHIDTDDSTKPN